MDKALKQRLVGASVIIALAVIVLPMLLSGTPEKGSAQSQSTEIPPRPDELSFETRRFPVTGEREESRPGASADSGSTKIKLPALPTANTTPESGNAGADAAQQVPTEGTDPEVQVGSSPAAGAQLAGAEALDATAVDSASSLETTEVPAGSTAADTLSPDTQGASTPAPVASTTAPASTAQAVKAGARYIVQVASLSSAENALKLATQLRQQGFEVQSDTVESDVGQLSRVRVGPFARETEATAASARIKEQFNGVSPRVLDLQPGVAAQVTNPADPLVRWVVQLGVFSEPGNAQNLVDRLRSDGSTAFLETIKTGTSTTYRVCAGPFLERDEAIRTQQQLSDHLKIEGVVMSAD